MRDVWTSSTDPLRIPPSLQYATPPEVAYFRDPSDTWFAADVVRARRWHDELLTPPDPEYADIRIAFIDELPSEGIPTPDWLCVLARQAQREPRLVVEAALAAWARSEAFRPAGASPEAYVTAGFQALCPPHPACPVGPGARQSLMEYLLDRPGPLGRIAREGDDGANRLFRILWASPDHFADEVLRERIRDEGGRGLLRLLAFLDHAEIDPTSEPHRDLAIERRDLLQRLAVIGYFEEPREFDRNAALALDWQARYRQAYASHYRGVLDTARETLAETAGVADRLPELERLGGVASESARRLSMALEHLRRLPSEPDRQAPQTAGIALGAVPGALEEARLASAAVLAALDVVHRRRERGTRLAR